MNTMQKKLSTCQGSNGTIILLSLAMIMSNATVPFSMKFYVQRKMAAVKCSEVFYPGVIPALHSSSNVFFQIQRRFTKGIQGHSNGTYENYVQSKLDHICSSRAPNSSSTYALA